MIAVAIGPLAATGLGQPAQKAAYLQPQPVLVELFTSEGCSDCPPADALLGRLDSTQFVRGARAIVLSEHVTYWNHLGWRDPFSFEEMSQRQQQYSSRFALNSVYTPQMVVDGVAQFVGSDAAALTRAVTRAAATPKAQLEIVEPHWEGDYVRFSVRADFGAHATLLAALAEDATQSEVGRGENAGRTLHHVAVVRVLKELDSHAAKNGPLRLSGASLSHEGVHVRLVVFQADPRTGRVLAVAEQTLTR